MFLMRLVDAHPLCRKGCKTVAMSTPAEPPAAHPLSSATVLRVKEDRCYVAVEGSMLVVEYAPQFPAPRVERVAPGHRVALARGADGRTVALWRWYDAVVIGVEGHSVRMWEPAHGEVIATPRYADQAFVPGTRAYLSAGLPGAEWWVAGPVHTTACAVVELDEVEQLYNRHQLWESVLG